MSRTPDLLLCEWDKITKKLRESGYDLSKIGFRIEDGKTGTYITHRILEDLEKEAKL